MSSDGTAGEIGAPVTSLPLSRDGSASVTREVFTAATDASPGHTKLPPDNAFSVQHLSQRATSVTESYRAQRLAEMLASIAEYRAASPAFRPFWRVLALHNIARFKRDYLQPERAAFEAAVAASGQRRRAA